MRKDIIVATLAASLSVACSSQESKFSYPEQRLHLDHRIEDIYSEKFPDWDRNYLAGFSLGLAGVCIDNDVIQGELRQISAEQEVSEDFSKGLMVSRQSITAGATLDFCRELKEAA